MKKGFIFLLGLLTGCILTLGVLFFVVEKRQSQPAPDEIPGLTLYEQPAEIFDSRTFEVFQVLKNGNALADSENPNWRENHTGPTVLLLADENTHYYDDQLVKVGKGNCARMVGVFSYESTGSGRKTVPVLRIMPQ